ncbi:Clp protease N-terminal domain-containing protein [Phytomonospora endophytica]|uniref:ATP-dependent Clp protease ATP-binding subunit ClpA n=1 Tax=Phytomonospora endophytica TaxID=714109 RepID=A0A841FI69_9ACTN|nr:Clp protease N-terminal domain-containing protein [Phytomonospora endophytica]MBB6033538.1 ATP-dependent Clp protease ATP-binding subunit ClpA [Phytomonospora endophytica]GIG64944.1 peptidase [Phytomonospora endophytica]
MFERFTEPARRVVTAAVEESQTAGDALVDEEHLAYALFRDPDGTASRLCGGEVTLDRLKAAFTAANRRGGLSDADTAALRELGIDVDAVVTSFESGLDPGRLLPPRKPARRHRPFSKAAKRVLTLALREVVSRSERTLGERDLLLGLLRNRALAAGVFEGLGVRYADVLARPV